MLNAKFLCPAILLLTVIAPCSLPQTVHPPVKEPRNTASEAEARKVIEAYFPLFSKHDAKGLLSVVNFPHIRVTDSGTVIIPSSREWTGDPTPLEKDYDRSELESLTFVQSNAVKAHALLVFSRYRKDGTKYISYPTLWVVTKVNGHWGIQVRSSFAP